MISFKEYIKELNSEELYKYHSNVPKDDFIKILKADPTHQEDDKGDVRLVGKYSKWMIGKYLKKQLKIEDLYKATKYLDIYNRHKDKLPIEKRDINKFINLPDLFTEIDKIKEEKPEALKSEVDIKDDETQITYEDESWKILTPLTKESACAWGSGTEWCTAHSGSDMFEHYSEFGELIILINKKKPKEKYQYHVHSGQ